MGRRVLLTMVLALVIGVPTGAPAQLPGGVTLPGGLTKGALLQQAKSMVADLVSMKNSGTLAPEQVAQVDQLLPKATSLTSELEQPQVDATRLPQLASNLGEMQKQVAALKGVAR